MSVRYRWNLEVFALAVAVSWAAAACAACSRPPPPEPPFVIVDANADWAGWDVTSQACLRLAALGCPEAHPDGATCYMVLYHAQSARLVELAPGCVADCQDVACVRACAPAWKKGCAGR